MFDVLLNFINKNTRQTERFRYYPAKIENCGKDEVRGRINKTRYPRFTDRKAMDYYDRAVREFLDIYIRADNGFHTPIE